MPLAVHALAVAMLLSAFWRGLIAPGRGALMQPPHPGAACLTAIPLAAITSRTDRKQGVANRVAAISDPKRLYMAAATVALDGILNTIRNEIDDWTDDLRLRRR